MPLSTSSQIITKQKHSYKPLRDTSEDNKHKTTISPVKNQKEKEWRMTQLRDAKRNNVSRSEKELLKNGPFTHSKEQIFVNKANQVDKYIDSVVQKEKSKKSLDNYNSTFGPIAENRNEMSNSSINERDMPPRWQPIPQDANIKKKSNSVVAQRIKDKAQITSLRTRKSVDKLQIQTAKWNNETNYIANKVNTSKASYSAKSNISLTPREPSNKFQQSSKSSSMLNIGKENSLQQAGMKRRQEIDFSHRLLSQDASTQQLQTEQLVQAMQSLSPVQPVYDYSSQTSRHQLNTIDSEKIAHFQYRNDGSHSYRY